MLHLAAHDAGAAVHTGIGAMAPTIAVLAAAYALSLVLARARKMRSGRTVVALAAACLLLLGAPTPVPHLTETPPTAPAQPVADFIAP